MKEILTRLKNKLKNKIPLVILSTFIFLFIIFYLFDSIFITIHSGEGGVLYRRFFGGTVVNKVCHEGVHLIFPWDKMYIYNIRIQQASYQFDVLTRNGLKVNLSLSIRYYPEYDLLGILHKAIGPDYLNIVVIPEIENVLRVLIGKMYAEEVYNTERAIIEKSINEAVEQLHQRFINVDNVIIKQIKLPQMVEEAIQHKVEQQQIAEAHKFMVSKQQIEKERKKIEAEGMKQYNDIINTSLSDKVLKWMSIQATLDLAKSQNSKIVVVGNKEDGLPLFGNIEIKQDSNNLPNLPSIKK